MAPLFALPAPVPPKPHFPLTVASIMRGPALIGGAPRDLQWSADGKKLYFSWAKAEGSQNPNYQEFSVNADGTGLAVAGPKNLADRVASFEAKDRDRIVYSQGRELYLFDRNSGTQRRLSRTSETRSAPVLLTGGKWLAFQQGSDLFKMDLGTGETVQLTVLQPTAEALPPTPRNASQTALAEEESKLLKYSAGGGFRGGRGRGRGGSGSSSADITAIRLPAHSTLGSLDISPSGKWVAVRFVAESTAGRQTIVPSYVTRSGYTEDIPSYEKVGDVFVQSRLQLVDIESGETVDLKLPREGFPSGLAWSDDGGALVVSCRSADHKDRWLETFDVSTHAFGLAWDEHDDAWVGGRGSDTFGWLPNSHRLYFESEKSGYAQLYTAAADGNDPQQVTSGLFEISDVRLDRDRQRFTFVSSEGSPFKRHLDMVPLTGGARIKLANMSADDEATYAISPDGRSVAVVRSASDRPPELFLAGQRITTTPTQEWLSGPWIKPPIVQIPARDGLLVPGHLYRPSHPNGAAVIFVHGAGYLQNVYEGWSYYYREYMFHHLLMARGYTVLDLDYRGSAGYGRAWRTAIYRHMGGKDLDDQVDGAAWMVKKLGVDPNRIGIYGGSYGGFLTLMGMFTTPGVFASGAALRPVSDWANYNHGYTSEVLNLPQDDKEAYKRSSPIFHAEGLRGALLICHGMVDTNVHFQDSVRLVERLIELGKHNWQIAPYPVEDHSFVHPESWTDEYSRILNLFDSTIGNRRQ